MSLFGQIITSDMVSEAIEATMHRWDVTYLAEMARQNGLDGAVYPPFQSFPRTLDLTKFPEDMLPACLVVTPGTTHTTKRAGFYEAEWVSGLAVITSGQDRDESMSLASTYAAVVRAIMVQKSSLGVEWVSGVEWIAERYDPSPIKTEDTRTLGLASLAFSIHTQSVVSSSMGPLAPIENGADPGDWPIVESAGIKAVTGEEITS